MEFIATWISRIFGWSLLLLSAFVALETIMRKLFNTSLQGADELGGYVLAFGSSLAFVVTLAERAHIRIDVLHQKFPVFVQSLIDWLAAVSIAVLGCFLLYVGWFVLKDTLAYGSTAATPWATPLIWPQAAWYAALSVFSISAIVLSIRATILFFKGDYATLAAEFNPKGAAVELAEELRDLEKRIGKPQ
ncbi:MAG: TRAP-type C4-dicarboxylate transport system permease small subunit [Paracoccaceae bacterium]|jgi:TRAP-type C4-dicarboxylate transport system permease small subunit|tara:strand:- start:92 stop:661 length:570 start_codon:yes stop_codon:yes gene_type:complete